MYLYPCPDIFDKQAFDSPNCLCITGYRMAGIGARIHYHIGSAHVHVCAYYIGWFSCPCLDIKIDIG